MKSPIQKFFFHLYPKNIAKSICLLESEVENGSFSAWSFANNEYSVSAFWADEYRFEKSAMSINTHPVFDLASLTKPLFINLYLMLEYKRKYFEFVSTPLSKLLQKSKSMLTALSLQQFIENNPDLSLNSFISHKSGLAPWCWMGFNSALEMTDFILNKKCNKLKNEVYSDLNYFILARIVESLPKFSWESALKKINEALNTHFTHTSILAPLNKIPYFPYEFVDKNSDKLYPKFGLVHDTNANIFSSREKKNKIISGHSGLFGNVNDIASVLEYLSKKKIFKLLSEAKNKDESRFVYGFDTPSSLNSAAAVHNFEDNKNKIFGHLGYTGTSFWAHSEVKIFHILLTNRTANRKKIENEHCPRIFVVENRKTHEKIFYVKDRDIIFKHSLDEIIEITNSILKNHKIIWNNSLIPEYQNLLSIRKQIGANLWGA